MHQIRIVGYKEALERLKRGEVIHWVGGADLGAFFNTCETVRTDTLHKLWKDVHITDYGFPLLHGIVKYKVKEEK